jgi:hypothetical protein
MRKSTFFLWSEQAIEIFSRERKFAKQGTPLEAVIQQDLKKTPKLIASLGDFKK